MDERSPLPAQRARQLNSTRQLSDTITAEQLDQLLVAMHRTSDAPIAISDIKNILSGIMGAADAESVVETLVSKVDFENTGFLDRGEVCSCILQQLEEEDVKTTHTRRAAVQQPPKFAQSLYSKEAMCRLMKYSTQYLTVSRDGVITSWNSSLHSQRAITIYGELLSGSAGPTRRSSVWVTDSSLMLDCNKLVLSTISRELFFYDLSTSLYKCQYKVQELPSAPICLTYYSDVELQRSYLFYGDELGSVTILTFLKPAVALFSPLVTTRVSTISYNCLFEQADFVTVTEYPQVHREWTLRVAYLAHNHSFVSCSNCSISSMVMADINRQRGSYVFRVRKGIKCFDYSRELDVIATGSADHRVRLWDPYVPSKPMAVLVGHDTLVIDVTVHSYLKVLFSFSQDRVLRIWDMLEHTLLQVIKVNFPFSQRPPDYGLAVTSLPLPHILVLLCNEHIASLRIEGAAQPSAEQTTGTSHLHPLCAAVYSPQLNQVISGCEGSSVNIWDISTGALALRCDGCHGQQEVTLVTLDASGKHFITGSRGGDVKVWNCSTGQCIKHFHTPGGTEVTGVVHLKEKGKLLCAGWNRRLTAFVDSPEVFEPKLDESWQGKDWHQDDILCMAYCPPYYVATGSFDGEIVVWNLNKERATSRFHSLTKLAPTFLRQQAQRSSSRSSTSNHSRPASRKLSSYRMRSSSAHVRHAPVDKLQFLRTRVTTSESCRGAGTLVSSEAGVARFWDIHGSEKDLGSFPLTGFEDENVMALTTDALDQYLVAGDTVGYISIFDIGHYCTGPSEDTVLPDPAWRWKAHQREVMSVEHISPEAQPMVLSASADCNVCLWTVEGVCVGRFGQGKLWNLRDGLQRGGAPQKTECAQEHHTEDKGHTTGKAREGQEEVPPTKEGDLITKVPLLAATDGTLNTDVRYDDISTTRSVLGTLYQERLNQRMSGRQERRVNLAEVDLGPVEHFGAVCSAYQALKIQRMEEVVLPKRI